MCTRLSTDNKPTNSKTNSWQDTCLHHGHVHQQQRPAGRPRQPYKVRSLRVRTDTRFLTVLLTVEADMLLGPWVTMVLLSRPRNLQRDWTRRPDEKTVDLVFWCHFKYLPRQVVVIPDAEQVMGSHELCLVHLWCACSSRRRLSGRVTSLLLRRARQTRGNWVVVGRCFIPGRHHDHVALPGAA